MKIALLGAPGSGKTKIARALSKELSEFGPFKIIDNYVPKLERRFDFAYGHFASYVPNLSVALERIGLENAAGENFITCGTIFETISYLSLHITVANRFAPEGQLELARAGATMSALGMMVADTFNYDYAFRLPYKKPQDDWDGDLDVLIPQILEEFYYYVSPLDLTFKKNLELASGIIRQIEKEKSEQAETTEDDEPSV